MKQKLFSMKIVSWFLVGMFLVLGVFEFINRNGSATHTNPLVNISELSEGFMDKYMADYAEIASGDNKENVLIVTSASPLKNTFGAKKVVEAANNRYFLEFETEDEKTLALKQIEGEPKLKVEENHLYTIDGEEEGGSKYNSWGIEKMGLDHAAEMIERAGNASEVVVAVLDTGLDTELFNKNFSDKLAGTYSVVSGEAAVPDSVGHGTHTAGTIAEGTPSNVKVFSVQLSTGKSMYTTDIVAGMDYATYYANADVVNMSFGGYVYGEAEYISIEAMREKKMIPVASAGNESTSRQSYPASFDNTISVSALDVNLNFASEFSNFGKTIDFAAPGVDILSINTTMSGTSMSAPHVSAAAAVAKSLNKNFDLETAKEFLATRAVDLGMRGKDSKFGYGFIDFNDAKFCTAQSETCDEFGIFETEVEDTIEVTEVILTPYNYGSLTNILATKVKIVNKSGSYKEKALGDFGTDVEITGYDPYASGEQEVTVKYGEMTTSFVVENPESWESGWIISEWDYEGELTLERGNFLLVYKDHGLDIKTLYVPEEVDGKTIIGDSGYAFNAEIYDGSWGDSDTVFSSDAQRYETVILPETFKITRGGFSGKLYGDKHNFQNLYQIISLADELTVSWGAFGALESLVRIDANIRFGVTHQGWSVTDGYYGEIWYANDVFSSDTMLEEVTLSENNEVIPQSTFYGCRSLESLEIPDGVKEIRTQAFYFSGIKTLDLNKVEKIESQVFVESNIEKLYIPATLTEISQTAFSGTNKLSELEVAPENPVFDSRDNSNAIIKTAEDKLYIGTIGTVIPDSVKTIGAKAFYDTGIYEIEIPEGVETIEAEAFANCWYLQKVILPRSLNSFEDSSFDLAGASTPSKAVFWIWNETYAKERVFELDYPYVLMDEMEEEPMLIANAAFEVIPEGRKFYAYDTITPENFIIKVFYYDEETDEMIEEPEVVTDYEVIYHNSSTDSLVGGYNYLEFVFDTETGYRNIRIDMNLSAEFLEAKYEVPTGLTAYSGQVLAEIELPERFSWMDGEEFVSEEKDEYLGTFTPEDNTHYATVRNIVIPVEVKTGTTFEEVFPDEVLRACIVRNLNEQGETTEYTEETVELNEVLAMTELSCMAEEQGEKIEDARGIERMTNLETLDLSGNEIQRINVGKIAGLESLKLSGNKLSKLDISNNPEIAELEVSGNVPNGASETRDVELKTLAYIESFYPDEESWERTVEMDLSGLDFLHDGVSLAVEEAGAEYDAENQVIRWRNDAMPSESVKLIKTTESGETITYLIYTFRRQIYITVMLDEELYVEDANVSFDYTGRKFGLQTIAEQTMGIFGVEGYEYDRLEAVGAEVFEEKDMVVVGKTDVKLKFYYKKKGGGNEPEEPEPGQDDNDKPAEHETDEGFGGVETTPKVPDTGVFRAQKMEMVASSDEGGARENMALYIIYFAIAGGLVAVATGSSWADKIKRR